MNTLVKAHIFLAVSGLAIAAYLYSVKVFNLDPICGVSSCGVVNNSVYSIFLGLPISGWGMMYYFFVCVIGLELNLIHNQKTPLFRHLHKKIKLSRSDIEYGVFLHKVNIFITSIGVLFSIYLSYLEAFVILAWCQWCVASAWISICLFILSLRIYKLKPTN